MEQINKIDNSTTFTYTDKDFPPVKYYSDTLNGFPKEKQLEPEKIIYNGQKTIVYWNDGTKNITTASTNEIFDPEIGFAVCLMKKMFGKKIKGKKLYRRMIAKKAECHDLDTRVALDDWKHNKYFNDTEFAF